MVTDAFFLLGLRRAAALDPDEIRAAFQKAAAASHPDGSADAADREARTVRFQQINEASSILTPVASRLKHLLTLEDPLYVPSRAVQMDEPLVALFTQVGMALQQAAEWTRQSQAATSFLAKASLSARGIPVQESLECAGARVREAQEALQAGLIGVDAARARGDSGAELLNSLAQRASFIEKWRAQLQSAWAGFFAAS